MASGSWAAARMWARADRRSRWAGLVALGLIAGVAGGAALASLAGAVRTGSALDRLNDRTRASDAIVFPSQAGAFHPDWSALEARPEVTALSVWALVFGELEGEPDGLLFAPVDDWGRELDVPVVVEGRMWDPAADDELVVADGFARDEGIEVGDTVDFTPLAPDGGPGPDLTMEVVGLVRTPLEALFVGDGFAMASPGLIDRHPGEVDYLENGVVQLRHPERDMAALEGHATTDLAEGTPILDLHDASRRVTASTDVERTGLLVLAAAIAVAGMVLAGQVAGRSAARIGADARVLEAIGMRRPAVAAATALSHVLAGAVAVVACVAVAVAASRWLPIGQARRVDPDLGVRLDAAIVLPGAVATGVLLVATAFATGWLESGRRRPTGVEPRAGVADWVRRHATPPVGIGTTLALRRSPGPRGAAVRPALLGATVGVLGVAAALTLGAGLRSALDHPERAGSVWDVGVVAEDPELLVPGAFRQDFADAVTAVEALDVVAQVDRDVLDVEGATALPTYSVRPVDGPGRPPIPLTIVHGRAPAAAGEAAIGPASAATLDVELGDRIRVGVDRREVTLVGTALFPVDVHAQFDEGLWLLAEDYDEVSRIHESTERYLVADLRPGVDEEEGLDALGRALEPFGAYAVGREVPPELSNLEGVRAVPALLAGFLAALAVAALLHVLFTTARVRAGDLAVLRALGLTRRGARRTIEVQAAVIFVVGLVLGIPLGLALGRTGWTLIAERVPLQVVSPLALVATAVLVPGGLLVAHLVAQLPAHRAVRRSPGEVLREE